jgi:hypothetical protein
VIALGEARLGLLTRSVNVAHHLSCVGPEIIQVGEGDIRLILQDGTYGFDQSLTKARSRVYGVEGEHPRLVNSE